MAHKTTILCIFTYGEITQIMSFFIYLQWMGEWIQNYKKVLKSDKGWVMKIFTKMTPEWINDRMFIWPESQTENNIVFLISIMTGYTHHLKYRSERRTILKRVLRRMKLSWWRNLWKIKSKKNSKLRKLSWWNWERISSSWWECYLCEHDIIQLDLRMADILQADKWWYFQNIQTWDREKESFTFLHKCADVQCRGFSL